jgi:acylpyruvate hydrolase
MRLATIRTSDGVRAARVDGEELVLLPFDDVGQLIASGRDWAQRAISGNGARVPLAEADFAPLTPWPEKIFCVGLNYADHAAEASLDIPKYPTLFSKYARSLIGADDNLVLPTISQSVDWEIELGVIIGAAARNVDESESEAAVAGYTIVNDISMRDWQMRTSQWLPGKTLEGSTPVGPFLVTPDEVDHAHALEMTLTVDGEVMQRSSSDKMVFSVGKIISYISTFITLAPGDLICTGTMSGVGHVRQPPVYLKAGNVVSCTIEGLGSQTTRCVAPSTS